MNITSEYQELVERIQSLSAEQHLLYLIASRRELGNAQQKRLAEIKAELQNLWLDRKRERWRFHDPLNDLIEQWR